jgi:hypothetical protein
MTPDQALLRLKEKPQLFFRDYAERCVYAALVMAGVARCYVKEDHSQWVRLATEDERRISAGAENRARA